MNDVMCIDEMKGKDRSRILKEIKKRRQLGHPLFKLSKDSPNRQKCPLEADKRQ